MKSLDSTLILGLKIGFAMIGLQIYMENAVDPSMIQNSEYITKVDLLAMCHQEVSNTNM
jgi:hypothetical protein